MVAFLLLDDAAGGAERVCSTRSLVSSRVETWDLPFDGMTMRFEIWQEFQASPLFCHADRSEAEWRHLLAIRTAALQGV